MIETALLLMVAAASLALAFFTKRFPVLGLTFGLLAYASPILQITGGADLRIGVIPVLLGLGMRLQNQNHNLDGLKRNQWLLSALGAVLVGNLISFLWTHDILKSLLSIGALVVTVGLVCLAVAAMAPEQTVRAVFLATGLIVFLSIAQGLVGIPTALESGRLRGVTGNANALAVTALVFGASAFGERSAVSRNIGWLFALLAAGWAASRAGTAAIAILVIGALWIRMKNPVARTFSLIGAFVALIVALKLDVIGQLVQGDTLLFRTNDSRESHLESALYQINQTWPLGVGAGGASSAGEAGVNVVLKLAAEIGVLSIPIFLCFIILMLKHVSQSLLTLGVFTVFLANNMFEGWMLTFGSTFTIASFLLLSALPSVKLRVNDLRGRETVSSFSA